MEFDAAEFVFDRDTAYQAVVTTLLQRHPEHAEDLEQLLFAWPTLKPVLMRLAFFVSPAFPSDGAHGDGLVARALRRALVESLRHTGSDAYGPFLRTLMTDIGEVLGRTAIAGLTVDGDEQRWSTSDAPLCQWATSADTVVLSEFEPRPADQEAMLLMISARVLTADDLALLLNQCRPGAQALPLTMRPSLPLRTPDSAPCR